MSTNFEVHKLKKRKIRENGNPFSLSVLNPLPTLHYQLRVWMLRVEEFHSKEEELHAKT